MATIDMTEAQAHFSSLVQRALMGEEIIITRDNKPVVRLERLEERQPRQPGSARGEVWLAADFDATPEDFEEYQ